MLNKKILKFCICLIGFIFIFNFSFDLSNQNYSYKYSDKINESYCKLKKINLSIKTNKAKAANIVSETLNPKSDSGKANQWIFSLWNFCISIINVALILILIYIGIVNILHLNYDTYQIKKILFPLIIAILLANFSMFICRSIVDFSSAISGTLMQNEAQISTGLIKGLGINSASNVAYWLSTIGGMAGTAFTSISIVFLLMLALLGLIISIIIMAIFLILSAVLYLRMWIIYLLAAIAPLAFIAMVLPATQGYFKQWWTWFLRFVFMGPVIVLILKVASVIGNANTGGTSSQNNFLGSVVIFLVVASLLVVALLVPWILGGSVMAKISGYASKIGGKATDFIPGISDVKYMAKGKISDMGQKIKERQEDAMARGKGLFEGKGNMEVDILRQARAQEKIGKIVQFKMSKGEDLDENILSYIDKHHGGKDGVLTAIRIQANNKNLGDNQLSNVDDAIKNGKLKFKNDKEANSFSENIDVALKIQQKAYLKDNEMPPEINNPLHQLEFDSSGKISSSKTPGLAEKKHAKSNVGTYSVSRTNTNLSPSQRAQDANISLGHIKTLGIGDKDALNALNDIDTDTRNNPAFNALMQSNQNFISFKKQKVALDNQISSFIGSVGFSGQQQQAVENVLRSQQKILDINGKPNQKIIKDNLNGGLAVLEEMHNQKLNYSDKAEREKFLNSKGINDKIILDNFENNVGSLFDAKYRDAANRIAKGFGTTNIKF